MEDHINKGKQFARVTAIAGGVGGAKMAHGLQMALPPGALSVIVNTGDDFTLWGLNISPDIDSVTYTLAGLANRVQGWGLEGDTVNGMSMMERYGRELWFRLGDMDIATHILRTEMLRNGQNLTQVTANLVSALGIQTKVLPMCNEAVATMIETPEGTLEFQEYFVRHRHASHVTGISFKHAETPHITQEGRTAIAEAEVVVFCPSNPFVSIDPILQVGGVKEALADCNAPKVAVSPIIGGAAIKGPAADMLRTLGHEVSAVGVAMLYTGLIDGMVIDKVDEALAPRIKELGIEVVITNTLMKSDEDRADLASVVLDFCAELAGGKRSEDNSPGPG